MGKREYAKLALHSLLLLLMAGLLLGYHQYDLLKRDRKVRDSMNKHLLTLMHVRADAFFEKSKNNAISIANSYTLENFLNNPSAENLSFTKKILVKLLLLHPFLEKIRYIDKRGKELIHISRWKSSENSFKENQGKNHQQTKNILDTQDIYYSNINLDVKNGNVEPPYTPTISVTVKVERNEKYYGLITIDLNVAELLEGLQTMLGANSELIVLNSTGGWITGGGFRDWQLTLQPPPYESNLKQHNPDLWSSILTQNEGQFKLNEQCHYYHWYSPDLKEAQSPRWIFGFRSKNEECRQLTTAAIKSWTIQLSIALAIGLPMLFLGHLTRWRARELQRALVESKEQLELVTQEADLGLLLVDHHCRVCWINPEAERLLEWSAADLIGENLHEKIHKTPQGESLHSEACPTLLALETGQCYRNDNDRIFNRSGNELHVSMRVSPYGNGEERKAILAITDVKDFVERERNLTVLATTDELTKVLNRRSILRELKALIDSPGTPPCVLMADIDFFKRVNDTHGHAAGDAVLKNFAKILRNHLRKEDLLGRYGGEEFLVVLCNTDLENAYIMAGRLRIAVAEAECIWNIDTTIKVTCSFGLAIFDGTEKITQLIARADEALYRAKSLGRNQVVISR